MKKVTWRVQEIDFIARYIEYLMPVGMLCGAGSGSQYVAVEYMSLEEWLKMAWSSFTWQECFRSAPALMYNGRC